MKTDTIEYLTLKEAGEYTHLGINAIRRLIYEGLLPSHKPGKLRLLTKRALDAYISKS